MAVKLLSMESGLLVAAGAADYAITTRVAGSGPGKIPWPVYYELGLIAAGTFHRRIGVSSDIGDPLLMAGLVLGGRRATALAMQGKLFNPAQWQGIGGDQDFGTGGEGGSGRAPASTRGSGLSYRPVGVRVLSGAPTYALPGVGGSLSLYPATTEIAGAAG